jgi:hypothetical protein
MLCTRCANDESEERFENDGGDGEDAGLLHHHPERLALEQEQEISEPDEALHRLVQRGEVDGVEGGVENEEDDQEDQRKRHQERDGRFALHRLAQRRAPAAPARHGKRFQGRVDHTHAPDGGDGFPDHRRFHDECRRQRNDLGALPLHVWGEGWGEGVTELSRDLNPSPHPSPYGRGSRSSLLLVEHKFKSA